MSASDRVRDLGHRQTQSQAIRPGATRPSPRAIADVFALIDESHASQRRCYGIALLLIGALAIALFVALRCGWLGA